MSKNDIERREREYRMKHDLLTVCAALHADATGASDVLDRPTFKEYTSWLRYRLAHWTESNPIAKEYDDLVKKLATTALVDASTSRSERAVGGA